ncbi:MAG TPA: transglycosylase SLT domain-containing protein [Longimicrobiales bacterium]|nr:transglycosylase SLT domain-containing protein [Longimicrobiales bacterium]
MKRSAAIGMGVVMGGIVAAGTISPGERDRSGADLIADAGAEAADMAWDLPNVAHDRVEFWVDFLTGRNEEYTRLWLERSTRYEPLIRRELRARGMPQDLFYFAMIESGFSNRAHSRAGAAGMWQFISETGQRYGLEVNAHVDERRDPVASTHAALDYLTDMHGDFGSWYLAAAGYNSGHNRIRRILNERFGGRGGSEETFWLIADELPQETRDYVPLMIAAARIGKDPERYGFTDLRYAAPLSYEEVIVPGGVSLAAVADLAGVEFEDVDELNAHFVLDETPANAQEVAVRLPAGSADAFRAGVARIAAGRAGALASTAAALAKGAGEEGVLASADGAEGWTTYAVRSGDTLWDIAKRYRVGVSDLREWNSLRTSRIKPGQELRVPAGA